MGDPPADAPTEAPNVNRLLPAPLATVTLPEAFAFPEDVDQWVRAVFVASVDGAATIAGHAGGLGNDIDKQLFALNRASADVILVGAGTARTEVYGPAEDDAQWRHLRENRSPTAPMAVVSHSLDLDFSASLFTEAPRSARTILITCADAPARAHAQAAEVAEVIVAGQSSVDLSAAIAELRSRGFARIVCEGGPQLFADLLQAGGVDELCLTRSPTLVAGTETRILRGAQFDPPVELELKTLYGTDDGFLYLLYQPADC
ncbi:pyrimidine reductase family protein [Brevibacterium sp. RIT 803]|uniref:pyrimidine reductase family protein n=1 Tax=Brevibacterium sp. RIT 803 TaxID=2810210 RepID=UPI001950890D|nr:pyrimidine reductase family protein [Brevibacterium sp. RIT 803]MBM6591688.1 pyrimidine reductase family protein [Brevibacterium sp. RIT 803]